MVYILNKRSYNLLNLAINYVRDFIIFKLKYLGKNWDIIIIYFVVVYYIIFIKNGDWGLGIGDWGLGPIPKPQSPIPIPNPHIK